ncbi:hypothetical protein I4U23_020031 [Adineta vaga]|nr:hypothetical protein I4U23_020031 [Adineta vaga]
MANNQSNTEAFGHSPFRGLPLMDIPNLLEQIPLLSDMKDKDPAHTLLIQPFEYDPSNPDIEPEPKHGAGVYIDKWDDDHVRLPCSPLNLRNNGSLKWSIIQSALLHLQQKCVENIASISDIKEAIEECHETRFEIGCLEQLLNRTFTNDQRTQFLTKTLPQMISLALNVDTICSQPPPLLRIGSNRTVTISQRQAGSLLACAFFCLFPYQFHGQTYQSINFHLLFKSGPPWQLEKLKCLLHYFQRITEKMPKGVLTFRRFALPNQWRPKWMESQAPLCPIHIQTDATIEDMHGHLQVDFANAFVGGGVMNTGIVQEEIRFTICPEMLISILLCEVMQPNECIFLIGCEQYVSYHGYAQTFQAKDDYIDPTLIDNWGRKLSHVVAMDAICFSNPLDQYTTSNVHRELDKAYTCFRLPKSYEQSMYGVATGNWGCGAFRGDEQLKAIIQIMAASEAMRPLIYITWYNPNLMESIWTVYKYLMKQQASVRDLCNYLCQYSTKFNQLPLFDFILKTSISDLRKNL